MHKSDNLGETITWYTQKKQNKLYNVQEQKVITYLHIYSSWEPCTDVDNVNMKSVGGKGKSNAT